MLTNFDSIRLATSLGPRARLLHYPTVAKNCDLNARRIVDNR